MNIKNRLFFLSLIIFFIVVGSPSLICDPKTQNIHNQAVVSVKTVRYRTQTYKKALGLLSKKNKKQALRLFLGILGNSCSNAKHELNFLFCYKNKKASSETLSRLSLWQSVKISKQLGFQKLLPTLLYSYNFSLNDPLNQKVYEILLSHSYKINSQRAYNLSKKNKHIQSPMIRLWRGRILARNHEKSAARKYFFQVGASTNASWILRAAFVELQKLHPNILKGSLNKKSPFSIRRLTLFTSIMKSAQIKQLKRILPSHTINQTGVDLIQADGLFLIRTKQYTQLLKLSQNGYTHLSQNPDILYKWTKLLSKSKKTIMIHKLLKQFKHSITRKSSLWKVYLTVVKKTGSKSMYFNEIIRYLNKFPSHYQTQDKLIEFLIGKDPNKIHWAHRKYWKKAKAHLPRHTGSGRFIYWLKQYYIHSGLSYKQRHLDKTFYTLAPGSFYAGAFWDNQKKSHSFITSWRRVTNRSNYLEWVSKHGGNQSALRFLARHNIKPYQDPKARRAKKKLMGFDPDITHDILLIFSLGHKRLGQEFLREFKYLSSGNHDRYKKLADIGSKTNNLEYSVYFTRQYLREKGISEDPFSVPAWLLKRLYPRPYNRDVLKYSRKYKIETASVYAIMRQESLFRKEAISRSGALGLMQIMPKTGHWLAKKLKIKNYNIAEPVVNIQMGTKFFSDLIHRYDDFRWAAIAYNGGPGNLRKWKRKYYKGDLYHFLEHLPKEESRNYCRITYQNYMHYKTTYALYP